MEHLVSAYVETTVLISHSTFVTLNFLGMRD